MEITFSLALVIEACQPVMFKVASARFAVGGIAACGAGRGLGSTVNVPLHAGITDVPFYTIFKRIMTAARENFQPSAVVLQWYDAEVAFLCQSEELAFAVALIALPMIAWVTSILVPRPW